MRTLLAVAVAALALPATAHAKELDALAVCGPDACMEVKVAGFGHEDPVGTAVASGEAPPPSTFLRLDFTVDGQAAAFSAFYEPRSGLVATRGQTGQLAWAPLVPRLAAAVKKTAQRVEPFPVPQIRAVRIGARRVTGDPSTYLSLLTVTGPSVAPKTASSGLPVVFATAPNPWTQTRLLYYAEDGVLQRGITLIRLPDSLAADLEAGRALGSSGGSRATPWLPIAVALVGAATLLAVFLRGRSGRRRALVAASMLALALPAGAGAKGPVEAALCGPKECRELGPLDLGHGGLFDTSRSQGPPAPRPYYELRLDFGGGHVSHGIWYEPRSGLVSYADDFGSAAWSPLALPLDGVDVEPFPAPRVTAAWVGDRRVSGDPSGYLALVGLAGKYAVPESPGAVEWIRLETTSPNPWTSRDLAYFPRDRVLLSPGARYVRVPDRIASALAGAEPIGGGRVIPWLPIATLLAGAAGLLLLRTLDPWSASSRPSSSSTSSAQRLWPPGRTRRSSAAA